jgi:hypothetical protein
MGLISRLVTGDGLRKSRLHTCTGERIDLAGLRYLPRSLVSTLAFKAFGYRQPVPWLGFRAVRHLELLIRRDWRVLEFGSGMSSLWFAERCGYLLSVESDEGWYAAMRPRLEGKAVDYRLLRDKEAYCGVECDDGSFDLVLIDGLWRDEAALTALRKVRPGGYVYLDNSDTPWEEYRTAKRRLLEAAAGDPGRVRSFCDLCPFQVSVSEGLLVRPRAAHEVSGS